MLGEQFGYAGLVLDGETERKGGEREGKKKVGKARGKRERGRRQEGEKVRTVWVCWMRERAGTREQGMER
jgi:hypothetical protein